MIQLKQLLYEQLVLIEQVLPNYKLPNSLPAGALDVINDPNIKYADNLKKDKYASIVPLKIIPKDKETVFKQADADRYGVVSPFNAKKIAKLIYDSKSFFQDDEVLVKNVIVKNIKNIKQYGDVNTELQKLTSGRGIGMYLRSFLNNVDRLEIIKSLITVIPEVHWNWTILNIMPFTDFKVLSKSTSSIWDKLAGNVTSGVPISNTETKLMTLYYPEVRRQQADDKRFSAEDTTLDTIVNTLVPLHPLIKKLPVHLRCFFEFLIGRTSTFTEADLHGDERTFLLNACLSHGLNKGFNYNYWKSIGATGALSLTKGGAAAETEKYGIKGTLINMISPNMPTAFMYTLGEISKNNIYKYRSNTIVVQDHYDFNSREYKMTNEQIIKEFTDSINSYQKGEATPYHVIRKAVSLREMGGYNGFRVNFILRYTTAPKPTIPIAKK